MDPLHTIIDGCIHNDQKEQKRLYERYYGYCLKISFRYIYRYDKAVDVVNDGFVKIFRSFSKFQSAPNQNVEMMLMGWMRTIIVNTAIDQLRKNNFLPEIGELSENIWITDRSSASDNGVLYKEIIQEIKKLPPGYRAVFNLFVIDGFSHLQISQALGISVGTSKSNLSKGRAILQKFLKHNDEYINVCSL